MKKILITIYGKSHVQTPLHFQHPVSQWTALRKELICKAIELDIIDIRTYAGYRGDLLVEFTTLTHHTVRALKRIAEGLKMEVVVKQNAVMVF